MQGRWAGEGQGSWETALSVPVPALRCPLCLRAIDSDKDDQEQGDFRTGDGGQRQGAEAWWQDKTKSAFSTSMVYAKLIICLLPTNLNLNRMQGTTRKRWLQNKGALREII